MQMIVVRNYTEMVAFGKTLKTSCIVKQRTAKMTPAYPENQFGVFGKSAYQPIRFPKGLWQITGADETDDPLMAPYFISTNAHQTVTCLDGTTFEDAGYGIHFDALWESTWGCFHLYSADDALWLAAEILAAWSVGVGLQVI
jgi:hypothetical protein